MMDHYMSEDPANTFTGGTRDWDVISSQGLFVYYYSGTAPNTGLPQNTVALNGFPVSSTSSWTALAATSTLYANCTYDPIAQYPRYTSAIAETGNQYRIYPNPATSVVNIDGIAGGEQYTITNIDGKHVASGVLSNHSNTVNVSNMADGLYIIKLISPNGVLTVQKFIKTN
jgi:hypothetical protein